MTRAYVCMKISEYPPPLGHGHDEEIRLPETNLSHQGGEILENNSKQTHGPFKWRFAGMPMMAQH